MPKPPFLSIRTGGLQLTGNIFDIKQKSEPVPDGGRRSDFSCMVEHIEQRRQKGSLSI